MDWKTWLDGYEVADSWMARRLRTVQERIRVALDAVPAGPLNDMSDAVRTSPSCAAGNTEACVRGAACDDRYLSSAGA